MKVPHGDDAYLFGEKIVSNFSSNVYQATDNTPLQAHLAAHMACIKHYPEPYPHRLEAAIARKEGVPAGCVLVTSGAQEAINLVAEYSDRSGTFLAPCYSGYAEAYDVCRQLDVETLLSPSGETDGSLGKTTWICNPNNPLGNVLPKETLTAFVAAHPSCLICIDQSYEHFTRQPLFSATEALTFANLLLLHSLTKTYAIPGLRLGYVTAPEKICQLLRQRQMCWSVNALAVEAGFYLLDQGAALAPDVDALLAETQCLASALVALGIAVSSSDSHILFCELPAPFSSDELKGYLVEEHGILIREANSYFLPNACKTGCFRIATQTQEENNRLVLALEQWLAHKR
ncbi:MAG: aminotransferase class I/II-fold pyridoxal phosphate-dependent enzyme [Bacteroides sp.]